MLYLDYAATTPCDKRVLHKMVEVIEKYNGNPSSMTHIYGENARHIVEQARKQVAALIGATDKEIIFTSGATESNNLAIKGYVRFLKKHALQPARKRVITLATEHNCVLETVRALADEGYEPFILGVNNDGTVRLEDFKKALHIPTALVSIAAVNNETGVCQNIAQLAKLSKEAGAAFHCDGAQAVGKIPLNVHHDNIDLLSLSAHKIYGPKGVGALFVRRKPRIRLSPLFSGGSQERGLRPGTLSPFLISGLGQACSLCTDLMERDRQHIREIRTYFLRRLKASVDNIKINGNIHHCWEGIINLMLPQGINGEKMIEHARDLAFSLGSACHSSKNHISHVLTAMGLTDSQARRSIRLSFGRYTSLEEAKYAADILVRIIKEHIAN